MQTDMPSTTIMETEMPTDMGRTDETVTTLAGIDTENPPTTSGRNTTPFTTPLTTPNVVGLTTLQPVKEGLGERTNL